MQVYVGCEDDAFHQCRQVHGHSGPTMTRKEDMTFDDDYKVDNYDESHE